MKFINFDYTHTHTHIYIYIFFFTSPAHFLPNFDCGLCIIWQTAKMWELNYEIIPHTMKTSGRVLNNLITSTNIHFWTESKAQATVPQLAPQSFHRADTGAASSRCFTAFRLKLSPRTSGVASPSTLADSPSMPQPSAVRSCTCTRWQRTPASQSMMPSSKPERDFQYQMPFFNKLQCQFHTKTVFLYYVLFQKLKYW